MLKMTEGVDIPLGRLEAIGKPDLDRNLAALKQACAKFAPGKIGRRMRRPMATPTRPKAPTRSRPPTNQLGGLRKFVIEKDIVTIPGTEEGEVEKAPSYKAWNFAYINIPGPYEKVCRRFTTSRRPIRRGPKEEQDAYVPGGASLLFTSAHEVYPGTLSAVPARQPRTPKSARSLSATPFPKAGPTTPKK